MSIIFVVFLEREKKVMTFHQYMFLGNNLHDLNVKNFSFWNCMQCPDFLFS